MTKKEFIKAIENFPDNAIICIQTETAPTKNFEIDEGFESNGGKTSSLIIICPEPLDDEF